jgi:hypothetical protein
VRCTWAGFAVSHLVSDFRSIRLLRDEFLARLSGQATGQPCVFPVVPKSFVETMRGASRPDALDAVQRSATAWRDLLADAPRLAFPGGSGTGPGTLRQSLSAPLLQALAQIGLAARATRFQVLLAAIVQGIGSRLRQEEICLRTVLTARDQPGLRDTVGLLLTPVALRIPLPKADESLVETVAVVRQAMRFAMRHRDGFDLWSTAHPELITTDLLVVYNQVAPQGHRTTGKPQLAGIEVSRCGFETKPDEARFRLYVAIMSEDDRLSIDLHYDRSLVSDATADEILGALHDLLEAAAACACGHALSARTAPDLPAQR